MTTDNQQAGGPPRHAEAVTAAQDAGHGVDHDYELGSPHLRHRRLRTSIEARLTALVAETIARRGDCRVLEVGGGHGTFTRCLIDAGAHVVVTETSRASADLLRSTFPADKVTVIHDETGEGILADTRQWDLAVMTAVIHHIPDYLTFLDGLIKRLAPQGMLFTVADPLFYPRMSAVTHRLDRAAYLSWRLVQGDYARGLSTRLRRLRGVYDETQPSDLVEYHVVRDGVDEEAIRALCEARFESVEIFSYWASQAPVWQRIGDRTRLVTDFGVEAKGRLT